MTTGSHRMKDVTLTWNTSGPRVSDYTIPLYGMVVGLLPSRDARKYSHLFEEGDHKFLITTGAGLYGGQYIINDGQNNWLEPAVQSILHNNLLRKLIQIRDMYAGEPIWFIGDTPDGQAVGDFILTDIRVGFDFREISVSKIREICSRTYLTHIESEADAMVQRYEGEGGRFRWAN